MDFEITYTTSGDYNIVTFHGDLTIVTITSDLKKHLYNGAKNVIVNLSEVNNIDSRGLSMIIKLKNEIKRRHKHFYILNPSQAVKKVIRETNMNKVLAVIDSLEGIS